MIIGKQVRMARAGLGWSSAVLAEKAKVAVSTVQRFESGRGANSTTVDAIQTVLEDAGVAFTAIDGKVGVQLEEKITASSETEI